MNRVIGLEGWRVDVGYPERERAGALLHREEPGTAEESAVELEVPLHEPDRFNHGTSG